MLKAHQDRNQLRMFCLENAVRQDSIVRVIDAFVDALDLDQFGFIIKGKIKNGAPAFRASDLLKLYYYGYLNRVRSSRRLQREAQTNLEAMWLLQGLRPGYKTIANFRKDNPKPLKKVFRSFNLFLKDQDLFDDRVAAVDGSKFRAQNSKKNNYNKKKVDRHLKYIDNKTEEYLKLLDETDKADAEGQVESEIQIEQRNQIAEKLDHLSTRKEQYQVLDKQITKAREDGNSQVSTSDPDARALPKKMNIVEVGYNVVTAAERKNKFITNFNVTNQNDTYALSDIALKAKKLLQNDPNTPFIVLADKGFDTGHELKICHDNGIQTVVATKKRNTNKKNPKFATNKFPYDEKGDFYTCPKGHQLTSNQREYPKKAYGDHRKPYKFKRYTCSFNICKKCPFKEDCVGASQLKASKGRHIERTEYQPYIEDNTAQYKASKELYRERQALVEHQFGTIKRQWGFDYTLLKTTEKVEGEFAIAFTCYNLRRAVSILGIKELIRRLKTASFDFFALIRPVLRRLERFYFKNQFCQNPHLKNFRPPLPLYESSSLFLTA